MGAEGSKQPVPSRLAQHDHAGGTARVGLENFGNTCYVNSVVQALFHCVPFRAEVLRQYELELNAPRTSTHPNGAPGGKDGGGAATGQGGTLLRCLGELFHQLQTEKRRNRRIAPRNLIQKMRALSPMFATNQQQDAHEFLMFILNDITETLRQRQAPGGAESSGVQQAPSQGCGGRHAGDADVAATAAAMATAKANGSADLGDSNSNNNSHNHNHRDPTAGASVGGGGAGSATPGTQHLPGRVESFPQTTAGAAAAAAPTLKGGEGGGEGCGNGHAHAHTGCMGTGGCDVEVTAGASASSRETSAPARPEDAPTVIQDLFEGLLASETRCLTCESVTSKKEATLGISVDVSQNVSLYYTLAHFSQGETLERDNKFHCNSCHSLQEARRSLRIQRAPPILALHLKRFKYIEDRDGFGRHCKLSCRVPFPLTLRLPVEGRQADDVYHLFAIVIHLGGSPHMGHYVCIAKTGQQWVLFDDEVVSVISERDLQQGYGVDVATDASTSTGYLLFYSSLRVHAGGAPPHHPTGEAVPHGTPPTAAGSSAG